MPRGAKKDIPATADRQFLDERSFVALSSGCEMLYGKDISNRRHEIFLRDLGRCQYCGMWVGEEYGEMHHVIHRGKGGSDDASNLVWSCRKCHRSHHIQVRFGDDKKRI